MNINQIKFALQFLDSLKGRKLPVNLSLSILENENKLVTAYQEYNKKASDIINEYAKKDADGNVSVEEEGGNKSIELDEKRKEEGAKKLQEIQNINIKFSKISMDDLRIVDSDQRYDAFTPQDIINFGFMLDQ